MPIHFGSKILLLKLLSFSSWLIFLDFICKFQLFVIVSMFLSIDHLLQWFMGRTFVLLLECTITGCRNCLCTLMGRVFWKKVWVWWTKFIHVTEDRIQTLCQHFIGFFWLHLYVLHVKAYRLWPRRVSHWSCAILWVFCFFFPCF